MKFSYPFGQRGAFKSVNVLALYHDFAAEETSTHYGDELDLQLLARTTKLTFTLKYAAYAADSLFTDTDKLWLSVDYAL